MITPDDNITKKELGLLLAGNFKELIFRDKQEFTEYSNKFEIGFNCDGFFFKFAENKRRRRTRIA